MMAIEAAREQDAAAPLVDLLLASLKALAAAGEVGAACQLAGAACAALRKNDPGGWRKFNVLLHRLSKSAPAAPIERARIIAKP